MTVRDLIQQLLLSANLEDKVELEVKTEKEYMWSIGNAENVITTEGKVLIISD